MYFILRPYFFKINIPLTQTTRALPEDQQRPRGVRPTFWEPLMILLTTENLTGISTR
jgi:hypothetical protein